MTTVTRMKDGRYAIDGLPGGPFLVLSQQQLQALVNGLIDAQMLENGGARLTRPGRG